MNKKLMDYFNVVEKPRSRSRVGIGLLTGVIAGGVAGLLFAPKAGKETRADLMAQAEIGIDKVKEAAEKVKDFAHDKVEDVKTGFERTKDKAEDAFEKGKDKAADAVANAAGKVEDAAGHVKDEAKKA
ncbi:MAG TPA: YtxH domain-containing protein [Fastidiosipila sp.]|nr:YtxH domain-containing protein [Fastidiosipila sp.]